MVISHKRTSLIVFLGAALILSGCSKLSAKKSNSKGLLVTAAPCVDASDFKSCLLSAYVNHPQSLSFPEDTSFSSFYDKVLATGYDREKRRKSMNKGLKKHHKATNKNRFRINDMHLHAISRTPENTNRAIKLLNEDDRAGVYHLDPLIQLWNSNEEIYDREFAHALLDRYSTQWMQKSVIWDKTGLTPGRSPYEVLSAAYEKLGDQNLADKRLSEMKKQRFYPLREMLTPVFTDRKKLSRMDGDKLKEAGFSAMAIMPWVEDKIATGMAPRTLLAEIAFAIRHGHADNIGDQIVNRALTYAYEKGDTRAIQKFADDIIAIPVDFTNGLNTTLKRADRLSQDVVLVQFLETIGDTERIKKISHLWNPLSVPLQDGKLPNWTGTSTTDYTVILNHADRSADVKAYVKAWGGNLIYLDDNAEFSLSYVSRAVSLPILDNLEPRILSTGSPEQIQSFYKLCASEAGIGKHKLEVREYCANKIQDPARRIDAKLSLAREMYKNGHMQLGQSMTKQALVEAHSCMCVKDRPFSNHTYRLADIIVAEMGGTIR